MFDPVAEKPDAALASSIVWFDAFLTNVDRTPRNTNMLVWHRRLWLIDHGAALYAQHAWDKFPGRSRDPFPMVKDHVLLQPAGSLREADSEMAGRVTPDAVDGVVKLIPDAWLVEGPSPGEGDRRRDAYREFLLSRLEPPRVFLEEAIRARSLYV
jgi:hypothetical protein